VDAQGRALENLRRGMQGMAQQMQQGQDGNQQAGDQLGQGEPQGTNNQPGQANNDPLGRPNRSRTYSDNTREDYLNLNGAGGAAQRAQRILEELRRKLGDPSRSQEELDYFERLLRRN
jgi:hypothetical protein